MAGVSVHPVTSSENSALGRAGPARWLGPVSGTRLQGAQAEQGGKETGKMFIFSRGSDSKQEDL